MFTVIWREASGRETIWEADLVQKTMRSESGAQDETGYGPGILVNLSGGGWVHIPYVDWPGASTTEAPAAAGPTFPEVFVMNRHGATIARYPLSEDASRRVRQR